MDYAPVQSDLIFVLAGLQERKAYGLQLFREGFAPRLILSVGRFEVRKMDDFGFEDLKLRERVARMAPSERHFFIELSGNSRNVVPAGIKHVGTFGELSAFASYLGNQIEGSITMISTSIHLYRVRWCCRRISGLCERKISYLAVSEEMSSFRRHGWWKRLDHWAYAGTELAKLMAYPLRFRGKGDC